MLEEEVGCLIRDVRECRLFFKAAIFCAKEWGGGESRRMDGGDRSTFAALPQ